MTIPFQKLWFDLTGNEEKTSSVTLPELGPILKILPFFRDVCVENVEVVIMPAAAALSRPVTVDLAWTPADVKPGRDIMKCPSGTRFTVGGLTISNNGVLPCDLGYMNPIIKSPLAYTNHPRLSALFHKQAGGSVTDPISASVVIRGTLRCSHPTLYV